MREALIAEGERLIGLVHPHIVRGYELIAQPQTALIMETLDGETLAHLIDRTPGGLPAEDVAWLGLHLASALRYLHNRDLLHLDVKPANVVAEAGRAKLLDLSCARPPGRYEPGVGTWCYLAPEQEDGGELGPPADVWGLGMTLYEAATGRRGRGPSAVGPRTDRARPGGDHRRLPGARPCGPPIARRPDAAAHTVRLAVLLAALVLAGCGEDDVPVERDTPDARRAIAEALDRRLRPRGRGGPRP